MGSIPNTTTFSLLDVKNLLGCPFDQNSCFIYSVDSYFDPTYKGSKNSLMNFRNYTEPFISVNNTYGIFHYNRGILYGANNCTVSLGPSWAGYTYTYSWTTGTYFSYSKSGDTFTISCNSDNYGSIRTDTLTFHLSSGGLTATFTATQFTSPN